MEMPIPDPGRTDRTLYCEGQGWQHDVTFVLAASSLLDQRFITFSGWQSVPEGATGTQADTAHLLNIDDVDQFNDFVPFGIGAFETKVTVETDEIPLTVQITLGKRPV